MFIEPPVQKLPCYTKHTNDAVNLALVESITKGTLAWYPDNVGLPAIIFTYRSSSTKWAFDTKEARDRIYNSLITRLE